MARSLWETFQSLFTRNSDTEEEDDETDRFVPSPMDLSVRDGHGGGDTEIQRELDDIQQQAADLEDTDRHR